MGLLMREYCPRPLRPGKPVARFGMHYMLLLLYVKQSSVPAGLSVWIRLSTEGHG
jgi:hypothetical protein